MWTIECADVIEWAAGYEGEPFHAILCDPPYEMSFMSKKWDGTGISFQSETWAALAEHLLPGGFVFAFGGCRTYHRLACALEDAGLRLFPCLGWLYGSGFPKSTRLDTQIDRAAGAEQEVIGKKYEGLGCKRKQSGTYGKYDGPADLEGLNVTAPATPLARTWAGHRYGLGVLKPALELIAVAQKPYQGRPVDSITATGAGAMWIDGGRIGIDKEERAIIDTRSGSDDGHRDGIYQEGLGYRPKGEVFKSHLSGRWPANFALVHNAPRPCPTCDGDGCEGCGGTGLVGGCRRVGTKRVKGGTQPRGLENTLARSWKNTSIAGINRTGHADADGTETVAAWDCEAGCPVQEIGEQSGEIGASYRGGDRAQKKPNRLYNVYPTRDDGWLYKGVGYTDKGTCARFYFQADWHYETAERLAAATPVRYQAKSSRRERDQGLDKLPLTTAPNPNYGKGGFKRPTDEPEREVSRARNNHPCCKPIKLCRWLATLLLPPPEYAPRRILIPFAGSGSEMIAAGLAGWEFVLGIERDESYCAIAEARLAHWLDGPRQLEMEVKG